MVHWAVCPDNNTQSATCTWPSSLSNFHSQLQLVLSRKLLRTSTWRKNGVQLSGQNVLVPRDKYVFNHYDWFNTQRYYSFVNSAPTWPTSNASSSASLSAQRTALLLQFLRNWSALHQRTEHSSANLLREQNHCQQRNRKLKALRRRRSLKKRLPPRSQPRNEHLNALWKNIIH